MFLNGHLMLQPHMVLVFHQKLMKLLRGNWYYLTKSAILLQLLNFWSELALSYRCRCTLLKITYVPFTMVESTIHHLYLFQHWQVYLE